jgi:hypothetical protein
MTGNAQGPGTYQKARWVNAKGTWHGTFAEIGAGQEVARWFFHVGGAAATVATTISAYDMAVSDALYGPSDRYVSRARLRAMLDHEYGALVQRLGGSRGAATRFFAFADTVAARSYGHPKPGQGWMGIRFQDRPGAPPSEIVLHVGLRDTENVREQEALGTLGVNLVAGAFRHAGDPSRLIASLLDDLSRERVEIDLIRFAGPCFAAVDNRLVSLQLVEQAFTDATLFRADGEVVQPDDVLHGRAVLVERGSFRPVTRVTAALLHQADEPFRADLGGSAERVALMEMSLRNLRTGDRLDHRDFLDRVDVLGAVGATVMISRAPAHYALVAALRRHTPRPIGFALGVPTLEALFDERHYADLGGGILEGLGRLFQHGVTLYAYPHRDPRSGRLITAETLRVPAHLRPLYAFLQERRRILPIPAGEAGGADLLPQDVLAKLQAGDPAWEALVPEPAARLIKARGLFGSQRVALAGVR